ncbi:hypothetical protein BBJ28_00010270 [Nothophytophthora sp. Chile5]|nr:hypothetical protein BBJ28_00010270 [Nothophytophthora sp. Chile5]
MAHEDHGAASRRPGSREKDVSVGEFDPATGLTHVTRQRGRLLFNMGTSVSKRQRRAPSESPGNAVEIGKKPAVATAKATASPMGTGLSLFPEEAYYLLQRGALAIYLQHPSVSEERDSDAAKRGPNDEEVSIVTFASMLAADPRVSLVCLEVYTFLKDQKLHPRRCLEPAPSNQAQGEGRDSREGQTKVYRRRTPQHFTGGETCSVAFDVWKTVVTHKAPTAAPKQKKKALELAFRVVVCRFGDPAPRPLQLRVAVTQSTVLSSDGATTADREDPTLCRLVPVKLAVVHHDRSVLLFEVH